MYDTTILIPARIRTAQDADWLNQSVTSAIGQGKIVIAYNNCEHEPLTKFAKKATVHQIEAKNLAAVRNFLVKQVKTPYYLFLDADDLLVPDSVAKMEAMIKTVPEKRYIYGGTIVFGAGHLEVVARDFDCEALTRGVYFPNGVLQPIQNYEVVGGWDEKLDVLEDKDWWLTAAEKEVIGVPLKEHFTYQYRQHENSMVHVAKNAPLWVFAQTYIEKKHKAFYEGVYPMCCGDKKTKQTLIKAVYAPAPEAILPVPQAGQILVHYTLGTSTINYYGAVTGTQYQVSANRPNILIDEQDAITNIKSRPGLLELSRNGSPVFTQL